MSRKSCKAESNVWRNKAMKNNLKIENQVYPSGWQKRLSESGQPMKYSSGRQSDSSSCDKSSSSKSVTNSFHLVNLPLHSAKTSHKQIKSEDLSDSSASDTDEHFCKITHSSDNTTRKAMERREKSRVAAQIRRNRESQALILLQNAMPISCLPQGLEKSGVIRIASHTLCIFNNFRHLMDCSNMKSLHLQSQSLIGLIFDTEKNLVYGPPALADLTGQHWTNLVGMSHYDLLEGGSSLPESDKPCRVKLACARGRTFFNGSSSSGHSRSMLAMCWSSSPLTLPPNTKALKLPNGPSPLILCLIQPLDNTNSWSHSQTDEENTDGLAMSDSSPLRWSLRSEKQATMFRSFHDRALVIGHVDESSSGCIGYSPDELLGQTLYDLVHLDDIKFLKSYIDSLDSQEVVVTKFYRMRTEMGVFRWTRSTIILCKEDRRYSYICKHEVSCSHLPPSNNEHVIVNKSSYFPVNNQNHSRNLSVTDSLQPSLKTVKHSVSCDPILINVRYSNNPSYSSQSQLASTKPLYSWKSSSDELLTSLTPFFELMTPDKEFSEFSFDSNPSSKSQVDLQIENASFICNEDFQPLDLKEGYKDMKPRIESNITETDLEEIFEEAPSSGNHSEFMAQRAPKIFDNSTYHSKCDLASKSAASKNNQTSPLLKNLSNNSKQMPLNRSIYDPMLSQSTLCPSESRLQFIAKPTKRSSIPVNRDRIISRSFYSNSGQPIRVTNSGNVLSTIVVPVNSNKTSINVSNQYKVNETYGRKRVLSHDYHSISQKSRSLSYPPPLLIPSENPSKIRQNFPVDTPPIQSFHNRKVDSQYNDKPGHLTVLLKSAHDTHQPPHKSARMSQTVVGCRENAAHYSDSSPAYSDTLSLLEESSGNDQKHFTDDCLFDTWTDKYFNSPIDPSCLDTDLQELFQEVSDTSISEENGDLIEPSSESDSFYLNSELTSSSAASLYNFLCDNDDNNHPSLWSNQLPLLDNI